LKRTVEHAPRLRTVATGSKELHGAGR
jgi:hypothetical protein